MSERIGIRLTRYLTTEDGVEVYPSVGADCDEENVIASVAKLLVAAKAVGLPPAEVIGGKLRPMSAEEVADYHTRNADAE